MAEELDQFNMDNILHSEMLVKQEFEGDVYADNEIFVCETTIKMCDTELKNFTKNNMIKQDELSTVEDNIKLEASSSELQNITNDNIKINDRISPNAIKNELDNKLVFCDHCNEDYQNYCTKCEMLVHILNRNVLTDTDSKAWDEMPKDILEIRDSFGDLGIFTLKVIPEGVKFGPFTGLGSPECWKLNGGKLVVDEDKLKLLNWMQYINPVGNTSQYNLLAFQHEDNLYYRSNRQIKEGEELLVYFGQVYEDSLNGDVEIDFMPTVLEDVKDVFACTFCYLGFNSRVHLMKHKSVCRSRSNDEFWIEELTQCSCCKIYLDKREYLQYHMAYCCEKNARSNAKVNDAHWTVLISYMEEHPSLATGKIHGPNGKQIHKKMWEDVSSKLNALGYGFKTTEKWQKTWVDYKHKLKKKMFMLKQDMTGTGGGHGQQKQRSEFEDRVLDLLRSTFCEGTGSSEVGLPILNTTTNAKEDMESSAVRLPTLIPIMQLTENNIPEIVENKLREEHNYSSTKRKRVEYEETIEILKNINNSVNRGLADINTTLKELCNAIKTKNS